MHCRLALPISITSFIGLSAALAAVPPADPPARTLAYRLVPKEPLRYRLVANVKGRLPIGDSPEPADLTAKLTVNYTAVPKTRLSDGTSDVDFQVGAVDLEVLGLPFTVPDDQARDVLNLTVTLAENGQVVKVQNQKKDLPFSVSVPGVDPKRLYALLFPIVFQKAPVREGDSWTYKSELLGGQGTEPRFSATLLRPESRKTDAKVARLKEQFEMAVDLKTDSDKKPTVKEEDVHRARTGKIEGNGIYLFDQQKGRVTHGDVTIHANIKDSLIGKPLTETEPKELLSDVEAKVTIDLVTDATPARGSTAASQRGQAVTADTAKREKP